MKFKIKYRSTFFIFSTSVMCLFSSFNSKKSKFQKVQNSPLDIYSPFGAMSYWLIFEENPTWCLSIDRLLILGCFIMK